MSSSRKIKVAYLANDIAAGGAAKSLFLLFKSLQNYNIEIYLYVTRCNNEEMKNDILTFCSFYKKVKIVEIHAFEFQFKKISLLKYSYYSFKSKHNIIEFAKELDSKQIDILHLNSTVFSLVPKIVKQYSEVKIITHLREVIQLDNNLKDVINKNRKLNKINKIPVSYGYKYVQKRVIANINNYSDMLISISDNEIIPFSNHKKIEILPNPYDFEEDESKKLYKNNKSIKTDVNICMLGSFILLKNHILLLKAISLLNKQNKLKKAYKFFIFGRQLHNPYTMKKWKRGLKKIRNYFQRRIDYNKMIYDYVVDNELEGIVNFVPNTYHIKEYMDKMDIIIRPDGFPWGRDIIEAMATRKAIIACGYSNYYIENEKTGILIPPASPELLADKIIDLAENPEKRKSLGENAFIKVESMCYLEEYGNNLFNIYKSLM